jgi:hypothetical protein
MNEVVEDRRVQNRAGIEFLPGDGRPDDGEDAGADDRTDAERRQRDGTERFF